MLTLAVGMGANTAMFSVVEGVLLRPLPYPNPDELIAVVHAAPGVNIQHMSMSPSMYFTYREQSRTFQDIGLYDHDSVSVTGLTEPEQVRALEVTDGTLPIFGATPAAGRWFSHADDSPGAPETVMLGYGYWRGRFGGDPGAVGRTIRIDGRPRQIIGVTPERFRVVNHPDPALILPMQLDRSKTRLGEFNYDCVARLKPGVTLAEASADAARMIPIVNRSYPTPEGLSVKMFEAARIAPNFVELKREVVGDVSRLLWVVMGSAAIVLLIACANVANLLLVRAEGRQHELAIRAALGASRGRIALELFSDSVLAGLAGSALGLGLAYGGLRLLAALAPAGLPRLKEIEIDGPVLLFCAAAWLLTSLLSGAIPVLKYAGSRAYGFLRENGRSLGMSRERRRARSALVVVQVALALVLLISSGLMIRSFRALLGVNPGFRDPAALQTLRLDITHADTPDPERVVRVEEEIARKIAAVPGVASVAVAGNVPMDGNSGRDPVNAEDHTYREGQLPPLRHFYSVSPGYFRTLGAPLAAGRDLTWADLYGMRPVAIVSANFAREYWGGPAGAVGRRIRVGSASGWFEIIGVAADVHHNGLDQEPPTAVYWPLLTRGFYGPETRVRRSVAFIIRTSRAGDASLMNEVRRAVWSVNPNLPVADVATLDEFYRQSMARTSFTLVMLALAGGMALLLGVVGLYGVIAYSVSQRTREIGVRVALGAGKREVTRLFVRQGLLLTGAGVVCGLAVAFALSRLMSSLLFRVSPADPLTFGAMSAALAATAVLASYLPSRRAAAIDPVEALRRE